MAIERVSLLLQNTQAAVVIPRHKHVVFLTVRETHPIVLVNGTRMLHTHPNLPRIAHPLAQTASLIEVLIRYHINPRVLKHTV